MTDPSETPQSDQSLPPVVSEAQRLLEEIKQLRARAEEHLAGAEEANKKANSEALFAFNAKMTCEAHSTAIATLKGSAESDVTAILANKQTCDEVVAAVNNGKAAIDGDQREINDRRKEVDRSAQEIVKAAEDGVAHLAEIENSRESAAAGLKSTKDALASATKALESTEETKNQADTLFDEVTNLTASISDSQKNSKQRGDEIEALLSQAKKSDGDLKVVWEHLKTSDEVARLNEQKNDKHSADLKSLTERIESLLPGATSAGLASSFNAQKTRFRDTRNGWLLAFVGCILLLVLVAVPSFVDAISSHSSQPTWNDTWRNLMMRLPIVLPLVWLAIYAGRNYMLSLRLEEDYAYKEAISTAFEGYKREMENILPGDLQGPRPLTTLCTNVLRAIAERPGRIYEGKQQDINLVSEAMAAIEKGAEFSKKQIAGS